MIKWAGRLITFYGLAHTLGALIFEGAAKHAGAWFSRELWGEDLANMSAANSAYWLSLSSGGPGLVLIGLTILWLAHRGVTPPTFIAWTLAALTALDIVILGPMIGQWLIMVTACALLLVGARRAKGRRQPAAEANRSS